MSSYSDWLTQEELLKELEQTGIDLPQRTLRFWVAKNLLPQPLRKPYRGADGRVGYYSRDILAVISRILSLQDQGYKLSQIQKLLSAKEEDDSKAKLSQDVDLKAGDYAARYLQDLLSDSDSRDRRRYFAEGGMGANQLRRVRHYLVARLERWLGRKIAVRSTSSFLLGLSPKDMRKLLARLKLASSSRELNTSSSEDGTVLGAKCKDKELAIDVLRDIALDLEPSLKRSLLARRTYATISRLEKLVLDPGTDPSSELILELKKLDAILEQAQANLEFIKDEVVELS